MNVQGSTVRANQTHLAGAEPGGARSGCVRNAIRSFIDCAGSEENGGMPPLPFVITLRLPSAPSRLTTVSISGPRSPFSSGPWQTGNSVHTRRAPSARLSECRLCLSTAELCGRLGINPPAFAAVDSPAGTSLTIDGMSFERT